MKKPELKQREAIGNRLKEARKLAGLSQQRAADLLDMHRPTVSEIEAGNRRVSADELSRFAKMYDVSVAFLTGDSPETLTTDDPRLQLAARELQKLKPQDVDNLLRILSAMRGDEQKS
jgi:transcriptional regulator with XRE-family HTH domain